MEYVGQKERGPMGDTAGEGPIGEFVRYNEHKMRSHKHTPFHLDIAT